jgi:1-deoxy-D-xylulose-5-phosphate synthase
MDRAGLTGPDGPTHHGCFDLGYLRVFPNMLVLAPGDASDLPQMLEFALTFPGPVAIRYPKATAEDVGKISGREERAPIELARAEVFDWGRDGIILACGTLLSNCLKAAATLQAEGLDIGVVNMRFVKPLDTEVVFRALETCPFVLTVEEGALAGGFGSAVLEAAADAGQNTSHVARRGIPDRFIEHGERAELLADLGLDAPGIARTCRELARSAGVLNESAHRAG